MNTEGFLLGPQLGVGSTAEVFLATHQKNSKSVALKIFSPLFLNDSEAQKRLLTEIEVLEHLRHPNIVSLLGCHQFENSIALELEFINGGNFRQWMENYSLTLFEPKLWALVQVCRGLGGAHEQGILHRDLKPENILVAQTGEVKITDFGLARTVNRMRVTKSGVLVGSLGYLAPEIIEGDLATERSDLFSFGVLAYELLAGTLPYNGETPQTVIHKILTGNFISLQKVAPHLAAEAAEIIDRCLARTPADRPETIWEVESKLMAVLQKSRMMRFCKPLVSSELRSDSIAEALRLKHGTLLEEIKGEILSRRELLPAINYFIHLFPDDIEREAILNFSQVTPKRETKKYFYSAVASTLLIIFVSAHLTLREKPELGPGPVPAEPIAVAQPLPKPPPPQQPPKAEKEKVIAEPIKKLGHLQIITAQDVDVFVDSFFVSPKNWKKYSLLPGIHELKLVKPGFAPISSNVNVIAGKTTVIRAGEEN